MILTGKLKHSEKTGPSTIHQLHVPHKLGWQGTRAPAARSRLLTAWATVWSSENQYAYNRPRIDTKHCIRQKVKCAIGRSIKISQYRSWNNSIIISYLSASYQSLLLHDPGRSGGCKVDRIGLEKKDKELFSLASRMNETSQGRNPRRKRLSEHLARLVRLQLVSSRLTFRAPCNKLSVGLTSWLRSSEDLLSLLGQNAHILEPQMTLLLIARASSSKDSRCEIISERDQNAPKVYQRI
jgi:hypothetical protein